MYKANYHTHTFRCQHAGGTEEDYVQAAIANNLQVLGISDHGPFETLNLGLRMSYEELCDYVQIIDRLKETYRDKITLYKGVEIEYIPTMCNYYEKLLTKHGLEYLVLGEHSYLLPNGDFQNIYSAPSSDCYIGYANAIAEAVRTGFFRILAHPDLCMLNPYAWDSNCEKAFDIILDAVSRSDILLEYNANGLRRNTSSYPDGERYPYPHKRFWEMVAKTNLPVIIGCDCHNPKHMYDEYVALAETQLSELGITPVEFMKGFEPAIIID